MKIISIKAIPVNIPYRVPSVMSAGTSGHSSRTVIVVDTDAGISGLGEASYGFLSQIIEREFAPVLVGLDALDRALIRRHCLPDVLDFGTPLLKARLAAWGGLEIALWDILGKAAGVPVYKLLGGAVRSKAPFGAYAYTDSNPSQAVSALVERGLRQIETTGASIFEFKVGVHSVDIDVESVVAVHGALNGKARIAIDANMGMSFNGAHSLLGAVGALVQNFEEPVASLFQMDRLGANFKVSVSTHCCDFDAVERYPHVDGIVPTLDSAGGIDEIRRLARAFSAVGKTVWMRSHGEGGVGWAAIVHLGISLPELHHPAQSLIELLEDDLILGDVWLVRGGGVRPPDRPGLGVELDWDAVQRCHEIYRHIGDVPAFPPAANRQRT